ncbi:FRIGIDA-like protein 3 [Syzygium oleosum]|uniref:FRIGIDA-like protein 3 n=1 Tax=Syzygium oleosum TaxID=219896 RepID=UPI0011D20241|nr:FRIGIDA-like protein 3 [Syzygium oleosum]
MAETEPVSGDDTVTSLIDQLSKALLELEACKRVSEEKVAWNEIEEHFRNLDAMFRKKFDELEVKEREIAAKTVETEASLAEREAAIAAKEQEMLDRVQELKNAAVAAIINSRMNHRESNAEAADDGNIKDGKVSGPLSDASTKEDICPSNIDEAEGLTDVKPCIELIQFCEQMDAKGLLNFTLKKQNNLNAIFRELSVALRCATDPARLVLDSLGGFYSQDETDQPENRGDAALQGMQKSCITFMEAMATFLAGVESGADHLLNPEIKQQAKAIADEWKFKLFSDGTNAVDGNALEAEAFLQLLSTFNIASEFDEAELCKLVPAVAHLRQAPELCRSLGLTEKVPGVVESLINSGRQIDAVHLIHAFQLTERFHPVPLLKTYLKDLRRNSQGAGAKSEGAAIASSQANAQELEALKAVIKCVKDYGLEASYQLDPLERRVAQLEKAKSDKKRAGEHGGNQKSKKPKPNGGFYKSRAPGANAIGRQVPAFSQNAPYLGPPAVRFAPNYQLPGQSEYAYQASDQGQQYTHHDRFAAPSYNSTVPKYGAHIRGLPSSHQPYS